VKRNLEIRLTARDKAAARKALLDSRQGAVRDDGSL
jgi:hypothetical protein